MELVFVGKRTEPGFILEPLQLVQRWYKHTSQFESKSQEFHWSRCGGASPAEIELIIVESSSVAEVWGRQEEMLPGLCDVFNH